jgi:predicted lipid-binding transport protein (Tim44 family)
MLENILLWFLLAYLGWKLLMFICPIRAKVIVRVNPGQKTDGLILAESLESLKQMPMTALLGLFKTRFIQITTAYASDQIHCVKSFMSDTVYNHFEQAIRQRKENGHHMDYKLVDFKKVSLDENGDEKMRWVDFETEQVNLLKDKDEKVIEGDPMYLTLVRERWLFRWDDKAGWVLSAVQNLEAHAA